LTQSNLDKGDEYVMAVSDPSSRDYGKHWTADEVRSFFAPAEDTVEEVKAWLVEHGIDSADVVHSENKGWLALDVPVYKAEELLYTSYYEHEHEDTGSLRIGCAEYYVPEHIQRHIDYSTYDYQHIPETMTAHLRHSCLQCALISSHTRCKIVTPLNETLDQTIRETLFQRLVAKTA
jgi:tripeptidyl-peptidase-1